MTLTNIRWVSGGDKHLAGAAGSHCFFHWRSNKSNRRPGNPFNSMVHIFQYKKHTLFMPHIGVYVQVFMKNVTLSFLSAS